MFTNAQQAYIQSLHRAAINDYDQIDYNKRFMAIDGEQGEYLADIITQHNYKNIVEFGSSLGISTCYLAAAAKKTKGHVIATEKMVPKAEHLVTNLQAMNLLHLVDVRVGDAKDTLQVVPEPIDFIFLDGQKNDYWALFMLLFPKLQLGGMLIADNTNTRFAADFNTRIQQEKNIEVRIKTWERSQMTLVHKASSYA